MTQPTHPAHRRPALFAIALAGVWALGCATALAGTLAPGFDLTFSPTTVGPGSTSVARFTITNGFGSVGITDLSFSNSLPAGLVIADAPGLATDCVNGLVQGSAGGSTILFEQGRLSAGSTCSVEVNVTGSTPGTYNNVSGGLSSSAGMSMPAAADLTIDDGRVGFSKLFSPATVRPGERSRLTFQLDASLIGVNTFNVAFSDRLPEGMALAVPANESVDCVGSLLITPGSPFIQFFGGFLTPGQICNVGFDVTGETIGRLENVTSDLNSAAGNSGKASATLEVIGSEVNLSHRYEPNPARAGESVDLVFSLQNTNRSFDAESLSFSLDLGTVIPGLTAVGLPLTDPCGSGSTVTGAGVIALNGGQLLADDVCTFSVPVQIPAGVSPASYSSITSPLTGLVGASPITSPSSTQTLFVNATPTLTKAFPNSPVGSGDVATVEFTLSNPSSTEQATVVGFTDNLTLFMTESSLAAGQNGFCNGTGFLSQFENLGDRILQVSNVTLAPGASCTFTADLLIGAGAAPGTYTNVTSAVSATSGGVTGPGGFATADLEVVGAPRLAVRFVDDPVLPGGTATLEYRLSYPEEAASPATNISFSHDLAAALPGLAAIGLPAADVCGTGSQLAGSGTVTFTGGTLGPGGSCTFSVPVQVPATALPGDYPAPTTGPTGLVDMVSTTGAAASDTLRVSVVEFSKSFIDDPVSPGQTVTLRYTLENTGTGNLTAGFFTDNPNGLISGLAATGPLPATPCGAGSVISGTTFLIVTGLELAPGSACSFDVALQVPAGAAPELYSSSTSSLSGQYDASPVVIPPATDGLEIQAPAVPLLSKTFVDDPVRPGDTVTLEFTVSNPDAVEAMTGLAFTDDLDAALAGLIATDLPLSDACGAGSTFSGNQNLTLIGGNLAPGASCTFSATLQVPASAAPGDYVNTTSVPTATLSGQPVVGLPATDELQITVLEASKSFANPGVTGSTLTVSYTLTNPGSTLLDGLAFTDDLDATLMGLMAIDTPIDDACGIGSGLTGTSSIALSGASLGPGSSCSFDVTLAVPGAALPGIYPSSTSSVTASGLPVAPPAVADLVVVGIPELTISPTTLDFGPVRVGTPSAPLAVTLENTGNDDLTVLAVPPPGGPFTLVGGTCSAPPIVLAPTGSCTLAYGFTPLAVGPAAFSIQVQSDDPASPDFFSLNGSGIESELNLTPNPLDFGPVRVGTTSPARSVTVSNPGSASLNVLAVDPATAPFTSIGGSCGAPPFSIAPGLSCTLDYEVSPSTLGPTSIGLTLTSDAPDSPSTLELVATGTESAVALNPNPLDFGDVGIGTDSAIVSVIVSNPGTATLNIASVDAPAIPFSAAGGSCGSAPFSVAPGASCTLDYQFSPTTLGTAQTDLELIGDAPSSPDSLSLVGNGAPAALSVASPIVDFGPVPLQSLAERDLILTSAGAGTLVVDSLSAPAAPFSVETGTCGALPITLGPGQACSLRIRFAPDRIQIYSSTFDIDSNDPAGTLTVELRGSGQPLVIPVLGPLGLLLLMVLLGGLGMMGLRSATRSPA